MSMEEENKICGELNLIDLLKLVHSEDAPGVTAMGPHLLAEAGGVSNVALWEFLWLHPLLPGGQGTAR